MASYILRDPPEDLWSRVKARADAEYVPLRSLILALLKEYVECGLPTTARLARGPARQQFATFKSAFEKAKASRQSDWLELSRGERASLIRDAYQNERRGHPRGHFEAIDNMMLWHNVVDEFDRGSTG